MARLKQFEKPKKGVGLGYPGAKRMISYNIGEEIEKQGVGDKIFLDAFGGGGSMSCEFLMRGWEVKYNDLDKSIHDVFKYILTEKIDLSILIQTREEFKETKLKDHKTPLDELKLIINSFGNNRVDFLYSAEISEDKVNLAKRIFYDSPNGFKSYKQNEIYKNHITQYSQIEQLTRLQQIERLGQLNHAIQMRNLSQPKFYNMNYQDFIIENRNKNAILYCDIPYYNSRLDGYKLKAFDHNEFYEFIKSERDNFLNIFISEYNMPDDFTLVADLKKTSTVQGGYHDNGRTEKLYII